jgi:hypothetical protein
MSLFLTGGVALAYAAGVIGLHRYAVHRRREGAQRFATLDWLDWDTLLSGLLPSAAGDGARPAPAPREGGPPPRLLRAATGDADQVTLLAALVSGAPVTTAEIARARFTGGEARWLELLAAVRRAPRDVLATLEQAPAEAVAQVYLREWLVLTHTATPFNRELLVFSAKRRVNDALDRFGDHPALYVIRARASGVLGFTAAALDDLARAVYFSHQAEFYVQAVLQLPFIEDARPALVRACRGGGGH